MWSTKIDPYVPCYCGSGKKYKFCCLHRIFDASADRSDEISEKQYQEAQALYAQGHQLMREEKFEEAIPLFERTMELNPYTPNPVNNLALCHLVQGDVDEALRVQREFLKKSFFLPAFGLANLSMFMLFKGEEAAALNTLYIAASQEEITLDAAAKICEMFARMRRYQDLFDFVSSSPYEDAPQLAFWAGAAAANIGNIPAAIEYLSDVPSEDNKISLAEKYLDHLENGTRPESVRGDWPMLTPGEFYVENYLTEKNKNLSNPLLHSRWAADFIEACINNPDFNRDNEMLVFLELLKFNKHPESGKLLRLIVSGTIGSDELRRHAALLLLERGDVKSGDSLEMQYQGKKDEALLQSIELDPDYEFCPIPDEFADEFFDIFRASEEDEPDWEEISGRYRKLLSRCPSYFPAELNLAFAELFTGKADEAEQICRGLISRHPDYLLASSLLLDILSEQERYEEADQLIREIKLPKKTRPFAVNGWLGSLFRMNLNRKKYKEAKSFLNILESLPDKHPQLQEFKDSYKKFIKLHNLLEKNGNPGSGIRKKRKRRSSRR